MENKHISEQPIDQREMKLCRSKWKYKHKISNSIRCCKSSSDKKGYSDKCIHSEFKRFQIIFFYLKELKKKQTPGKHFRKDQGN